MVARGTVEHRGVDIACAPGTMIIAATSGVVEAARWDGTGVGGWLVIMRAKGQRSSTTYKFLYAHMLLPPFVGVGAALEAGALLGLTGQTGGSVGALPGAMFARGPHLHFSVSASSGKEINTTAQLASLVQRLPSKPATYIINQDLSGLVTQQAVASAHYAANQVPDWYLSKLSRFIGV